MSSKQPILWAKLVAMLAFLVLLSTVYMLRGKALTLARIGFSADKAKADLDEQRVQETFAERTKRHEVAMKNYELQLEHYEKMLEFYSTDYDAYMKLVQEKGAPPQPPQMPQRPEAPPGAEYEQRMAEIKVEFRQQKFHYFRTSTALNWVAWIAALGLCGGLLYLLMFDLEGQRVFYAVTLVVSFVFMIGPVMQWLLAGIVGLLQPEYFHGLQ